jgi:3-phenylpropionate/cinnamic acid dioxygenase small subunit
MGEAVRETQTLVSAEIQHQVEQFYYWEAELLDARRYGDWIELFAEDLHYWMPVRTTRLPREEGREIEGPTGAAHFDDDKTQMTQRVRKLLTGRSWSEAPASRTRHMITNVRIRLEPTGDLTVMSSFFVYRTRGERYQDTFVGCREDLLRDSPPVGFSIARRTVLLDQTVVLANNISTFF